MEEKVCALKGVTLTWRRNHMLVHLCPVSFKNIGCLNEAVSLTHELDQNKKWFYYKNNILNLNH